MADQFLGEIRIVGFNFPPQGWASCDGQILPLSQNTALFSLLGTNYGGNGASTFALPDMRGRAPMAPGNGAGLSNRVQGESVGSETITLSSSQMPAHTHGVAAQSSPADRGNASGAMLAQSAEPIYANAGAMQTLSTASVTPTGGSSPHNNMQPFLTLNFVIALSGIFPARP